MIARRFEMTPYRVSLALDILTGLVIVSIAVALAHLTWRMAGHADTGAITVPTISRAAPIPDLSPAIALAPFGRPALDGDAATPTGLQLTLKGIVFARPATLSVAYIGVGTEIPRPFAVGEAVSGATIQAIQVHRVLLMNGGRVESLSFPDPFAKPIVPGAAIAGTSPAPAPIAPPPPPIANTAAALINRLDAQPVTGGYRIGANAPPGLQQGDVIQQVNGAALATPDAAQAAFARAQASGTAQVQIMRDGKPVTLTVPIR